MNSKDLDGFKLFKDTASDKIIHTAKLFLSYGGDFINYILQIVI